jgi:tetratricopeptide (TPR) repeat protein
VPDFHADIDRLIHSLRKHLISLSTENKDESQGQSAVDARRKDDQKKEPGVSEIILDRRQDDDQPSFTETNVIPEDDERARHQIELNRDQTKKKRGATIFKSLVAVLVVIAAGVSWYIDFEYAEQYDSAIASFAAMQGSASDDEAELMADAAALARGAANVVAESNLESEAIAEVQDEIDTITEVQPEPEANTEAEGDPELVAAADSEDIIEDTLETEAVAEVPSENETIEAAQVEAPSEAQLKLDATAAFREGSSLAALGNHEAAIQQFDQAIPLIAEPAFVLKQRGTSYHALGNYVAAIEDFSEAIRLNAEDANAFFKRGAAYQELEDYVAAIENYDEVIRLNPEFAAAFQSRGAANELLGNQVAAERDLAVATGMRNRQSDP